MIRSLVCACLAFTLAACAPQVANPVLEEEVAREAILAQSSLADELTEMQAVVTLTPEQYAALEQHYTKRNTAIQQWIDSDKGKRLIALEAELSAQANNSDLAGVKTTIAEARPLREELTALVHAAHEDLLNTLGAEGRLRWEAHELSNALLDLMTPLALDALQQEKLREASPQFLLQAKNANEANPRAAAFLQLEQWAEQSILTPTQANAFQPIKKDNPMRSL